MAGGTIRRRKSGPRCRVYRGRGLLPFRQVAAVVPAVGRRDRQSVVVVEVAGGARHIRKTIGQQKPGSDMIELRAQPIVKRDVARFAGSSKLRADVVRIRSLLKIPQMAGSASR